MKGHRPHYRTFRRLGLTFSRRLLLALVKVEVGELFVNFRHAGLHHIEGGAALVVRIGVRVALAFGNMVALGLALRGGLFDGFL